REAKNYLTGNFAMQLEEPETIADFAINIERYNLPKNYYKDYLKNLDKVNPDEVQTAANKYINPEHANLLIVGKADSIEEKLQSATGIKKINYYNRFGTEVNKIGEVPFGLTASKIIDAYIDSIGGRENMLKVTDRTTVLKGRLEQGGIEVQMTIYQKAPDYYLQKTERAGVEQKVIFDGEKGYLLYGDEKTELKGEELEKLKYKATFRLVLNLDAYGVKVDLLGTDEVNGKKAYKVGMVFPSGEKWIQYYDPETGLKVKEEKPVKSAENVYTEESIFSDYREVNGVKYPFRIEQSLGSQKFVFSVDSIKVNTGLSQRNFTE
ncbi:MAG TPA: hypothetical protein VMT35_16805, partial [Ignavibacteriaceae bacterium]|nr:hypothetical protein [Ignavibacteriaceae bacterium]